MTSNTSPRFHYGFLIVFAICAICMTTVTLSFNTAGIFYTPVSEELGIGTGVFGTYMTVQYLAMAISMIVGGKVLHRFDARIVLTVCVLMVSVGLLAMSTYHALWQFYASAVIIGAANSILLYLMVPTMIDRWFKERVGFFVGLALAFTGIGAIIFNPVGGFFIENYGWRVGYLAFGLISACVGLPCAFFIIRDRPAQKGMLRFGETLEQVEEDASPELSGFTFTQAIRTPALYLCGLYAAMMDVGITLNYYLPSYVGTLGYEVLVTSTVASSVMVGQMAGKLVLGWINDHSVKMGVTCAVTCGIVGIALMTFFGWVGLWVLYIGGFLFGVFFAGATVTTSLMTRGIFGSKDYARIFSVVATVATLSSAFSSGIWGALIELTGGYTTMLYVGMAGMLITYFIGYSALASGKRAQKKWMTDGDE
ncbi:MFS transporter [Slackia heliotrinireducens]|uniref:MFS transporter n=1 Tax=Slackia heliotrinireducens TaxID=84110 RepID=UPI003314AEC9